jgi:hypothetical protein
MTKKDIQKIDWTDGRLNFLLTLAETENTHNKTKILKALKSYRVTNTELKKEINELGQDIENLSNEAIHHRDRIAEKFIFSLRSRKRFGRSFKRKEQKQ